MKKITKLRSMLGLNEEKPKKVNKLMKLLELSQDRYYKRSMGYVKATSNKKGTIGLLILKDSAKYALFDLKRNNMNFGNLAGTLQQAGLIDKNDVERPTASFSKTIEFLKDLLMVKNKVVKKFIDGDGKKIANYIIKSGLRIHLIAAMYPELPNFLDDNSAEEVIEGFPVFGIVPENKRSDFTNALKIVNRKLDKYGFGHLKGTKLKIGTYGGQKNADYSPNSDFVGLHDVNFFSNNLKEMVRIIIHELGHKQWHKFKCDQNLVSQTWYDTTRNLKSTIKKGMIFDFLVSNNGKKKVEVIVRSVRKSGKVGYTDVNIERTEGKYPFTLSYLSAKKWLRNKDGSKITYPLFAVSDYGMTKLSEFWAEVFAHALRGSKPELLDFVLQITGKKDIDSGESN